MSYNINTIFKNPQSPESIPQLNVNKTIDLNNYKEIFI